MNNLLQEKMQSLMFEYRALKRPSYCKCCGDELEKDKGKAIVFYSLGSQSPTIMICDKCIAEMYHATCKF